MKTLLKSYYQSSEIGFYVIKPFARMYQFFLHRKYLSREEFIKQKFKKSFGYELDLQNPKTLNEKINWLKLNNWHPSFTQFADKYAVREYIAKTLGEQYLVPLLFTTKNPREIVPDNLPEFPCIIKTNHDSSGGIIIRDKYDNHNWKEIQSFLRANMSQNFYWVGREPQYKNLMSRIVVEKLLTDKNGAIPYDFKMHCFNGKVVFTQVDLDRQINHTRNLYDVDWKFIPCKWKYKNGKHIEKPIPYEKMQNLAETIAKDFINIRVDFYVVENKIFFGELTFHSESGLGKFEPEFYDQHFGSLLNLP